MEKFHHDYMEQEWGQPTHGDQALFELLSLEGFQAGLSWQTILSKRAGFNKAFANFDIEKVANFDAQKIESLVQDAAIIRHRQKIMAVVNNAKVILKMQATQSFDDYCWQWVDGKPSKNLRLSRADVPAKTPLSTKMANDMKQKGFKFVGSITVYSFMQAAGMVDDRLTVDSKTAAPHD